MKGRIRHRFELSVTKQRKNERGGTTFLVVITVLQEDVGMSGKNELCESLNLMNKEIEIETIQKSRIE